METELSNGCDGRFVEVRPERFFYMHLLWFSIGINQECNQADPREFFSFESFGRKIRIDGGNEYRSGNSIGIWLWWNVGSRQDVGAIKRGWWCGMSYARAFGSLSDLRFCGLSGCANCGDGKRDEESRRNGFEARHTKRFLSMTG
jgi:hypothetical protein